MTSPPLPGPKIILIGDSGTGKTHALRTLLDAGITPFIIFTEPGMETVGDILDKCHWKYIPPTQIGWGGLSDIAKKISILDYDGIAKLRDANKPKYTELLNVIEQCNNFVDQNGESFGDVMTWKTDRALAIDSLSGLSDMASQLTVGGKPVKGLQDWQVAQNMLKFLIDKLTTGCSCTFILTSHIAREKDEITGGTTLMVSTLGKALAPDLPRYFSDIIQTVREGDKFKWSTAGSNIAVKARNVPISPDLPPSFKPLFESWKKRGGVLAPTEATSNHHAVAQPSTPGA